MTHDLPPMKPSELVAFGRSYFAPRWVLIRVGVVAALIIAALIVIYATGGVR